jgi:hypothetical protein
MATKVLIDTAFPSAEETAGTLGVSKTRVHDVIKLVDDIVGSDAVPRRGLKVPRRAKKKVHHRLKKKIR